MLLIRPDHIGDVLLGAEAVALLRASLPEAHLTYLVGPWSAEVARCGPPVDEVRQLAFPGFTRRASTNLVAPYVRLVREAWRLRRERFDLAVILRADHWWGALLATAAGIPLRVGGATPETKPLLSHACTTPPAQPAAEQALDIARAAVRAFGAEPVAGVGTSQFVVRDAARQIGADLWCKYQFEGRRVVGMHPSAGVPLKSWPVERWAHVADGLIERGFAVVLVGAPDDHGLLEAVRTRMRRSAPILCGQSLEVSAAIYARCALVVTVDGGAGHLAAAVGAPTVRLYGPAPLAVFGPWPRRADQQVLLAQALACVPCGDLQAPPCGAHSNPACMLALGVDDVLNAARDGLDRG